MNYRKSIKIFRISAVVFGALALLQLFFNSMWPMILGSVILIAGAIQTEVFYRCPYCNKTLNIRGGDPKYCPECGSKMPEEE